MRLGSITALNLPETEAGARLFGAKQDLYVKVKLQPPDDKKKAKLAGKYIHAQATMIYATLHQTPYVG